MVLSKITSTPTLHVKKTGVTHCHRNEVRLTVTINGDGPIIKEKE